ncbi:hypothetical protein [Streptomyces sp. NPDC093589]|uniref:hypothetical protein n=1 Tax=Streptomyces sp. NPDC093589 TaxID=3366043 RepID=UPI00382D3E63
MDASPAQISEDLKHACKLALAIYGRSTAEHSADWEEVHNVLLRVLEALVEQDTTERDALLRPLPRLAANWRQRGDVRTVRALLRHVVAIREDRDPGPLIFVPAQCNAEIVAARLYPM